MCAAFNWFSIDLRRCWTFLINFHDFCSFHWFSWFSSSFFTISERCSFILHRESFFFIHLFYLSSNHILFSCGAAPGRPLAHSPAQNQTLSFWARASQLPISLIFVYLDRFHFFLIFIDVTMIFNQFSCISIWISLISIDSLVVLTIFNNFRRFLDDIILL